MKDSDQELNSSDSFIREISIEIIPEEKLLARAKNKKTCKEERQISFKKARACAHDRKKNKKTK